VEFADTGAKTGTHRCQSLQISSDSRRLGQRELI
jgi:hypothetical protein